MSEPTPFGKQSKFQILTPNRSMPIHVFHWSYPPFLLLPLHSCCFGFCFTNLRLTSTITNYFISLVKKRCKLWFLILKLNLKGTFDFLGGELTHISKDEAEDRTLQAIWDCSDCVVCFHFVTKILSG
jgi:hypothetical protein